MLHYQLLVYIFFFLRTLAFVKMKGCFDEPTYRKGRSGNSREGKGESWLRGRKGEERIEGGGGQEEKRGEK